MSAIGKPVMPFGVARGSDGNSLLCGVPRYMRPSEAAPVPGVALPLAMGASVFGFGVLMDGKPTECVFHEGSHLEVAGLNT